VAASPRATASTCGSRSRPGSGVSWWPGPDRLLGYVPRPATSFSLLPAFIPQQHKDSGTISGIIYRVLDTPLAGVERRLQKVTVSRRSIEAVSRTSCVLMRPPLLDLLYRPTGLLVREERPIDGISRYLPSLPRIEETRGRSPCSSAPSVIHSRSSSLVSPWPSAWCDRCGARWIQEGSEQRAVHRLDLSSPNISAVSVHRPRQLNIVSRGGTT
jgi:hypothetical protein